MNFKFGYRIRFGGKEEKEKKECRKLEGKDRQREYFISDCINKS